ncbi:MAG: hypothetical protein K9J85_10650 [Desulfobacteraceae bacterium]|nr:hypothetical protein [Desulfobacteraceae bacterium]
MKLLKFIVLTVCAAIIIPGAVLAGDIENSRLMPEDKVAVYQDGKKIAEYSEEMPVPEGRLLETAGGRCAIRLADISIVAEDQSRFAVESDDKYSYLSVISGTVYFGLTDGSRSTVFLTPKGAVSTEQVMLNASSNSRFVEGYVKVTDETSEVGVLDGGSIILASADGQQKLDTGQSMLLAQAGDNPESDRQTPPPAGWWSSLSIAEKNGVVAIGAIGIGGTAYAISYDDDEDASPSAP